jgi:uncharacterized membrane protein YidH (DUF202 family)
MRINLIIGLGIILIILGIVSFAYHGIPYTSRENVIDAGSTRTSGDTQKTIPMSLLSIGVLLVSGAALVAFGSKNSP